MITQSTLQLLLADQAAAAAAKGAHVAFTLSAIKLRATIIKRFKEVRQVSTVSVSFFATDEEEEEEHWEEEEEAEEKFALCSSVIFGRKLAKVFE